MRKQKETLPPHAPKIEIALLGAMMLDSMAYYRVTSQQQLVPSDFYSDVNASIFSAIDMLAKAGKSIDMMTVAEQLKKNGTLDSIGGAYYLVEITNTVASSANIEYHTQIMKQHSMKRELIKLGDYSMKGALDPTFDVLELTENVQKRAMEITDKLTKSEDNINEILKDIDNGAFGNIKESQKAISTGIIDLDTALCGGVEQDDFIAIGADSGGGKTALAMNIVLSFLENDKHLAFFSYEMKTKKLLIRLIAGQGEIKAENIKIGNLSSDEYTRYILAREWVDEKIKKGLLKVYDCSGMTIETLRAKCVALKFQQPLHGVFIDYLQLIESSKNFKDLDSSATYNSREILKIKNQIEAPFIVLSQLRKNKPTNRPTKHDLFGSQALENCASKILLIDRPETRDEIEFADGTSTINKAKIYIDKNREGKPSAVKLHYNGECFKFENDIDKYYSNQTYSTAPNSNLVLGSQTNEDDSDDMPF